jgi:hypothetical protein
MIFSYKDFSGSAFGLRMQDVMRYQRKNIKNGQAEIFGYNWLPFIRTIHLQHIE